ncbi:MAG: potassium-transporting ATPase subunit KdpB, partial [Candidatus Margulisbacteria bacterium]|nr:potassium-transporting ATPase subunit KdpB [Candidatus Margulisiibacteriota bacterium]
MGKHKVAENNKNLIFRAVVDSFRKLNPREEMRNPVMFLTYIGAIVTTLYSLHSAFNLVISVWLWFTVLFANFAEALAEGRGKAQADALKRTRSELQARLLKDGKETIILASKLRKGDIVVCEASDTIPCDGEVIEGIASVDESAITGESAPVIRESGGDRSAVTGGTRVISDRIVIQVTSNPGDTFLDRIILLIEGAKRQKTPNEIALSIVLSGLSIIFLLAVVSLKLFADYSGTAAGQDLSSIVTVPVLVALLVCLIPTTIGGLLSAIGIAGMDRLIRRHIIAKSGRSIEAAGDIDVLLLDKTGTITIGNRMASEFLPAEGMDEKAFAEVAQLSSLADETPEGRSIVVLAKEKFDLRARTLQPHEAKFIPFSANTQMSGIDFLDHEGKVTRSIKKGSVE